MLSEEKKAIEDLKSFKSISILYGNTFTMFLDQLKKYQESTETVLNLIAKLQKEIDLMAEHIASSAIVDDTVCAIKCDCESDILEDCSHEKMLNCTKQYFETKAKGE